MKKRFLAMYKRAHAGHIGSSLSCAEILVFLKYAWMRDEDTFVLSKGHAVAALYALLAEANALDPRELDSFYEEGTRCPPFRRSTRFEEIPFATGSLGHGLSLCAGMALGAALNRRERRFFCLTSDGELDEGSTWEAALFIAHRKLTNVVWLIDRNRIQAIGGTEEVLALEPLDAKLDAFGFHVIAADGHDFASLLGARDAVHARAGRASGRPRGHHRQHDQGQRHPSHARHGGLPLPADGRRAVRAGARRAGDRACGCGGRGPRCGMSSRGRWSRSSASEATWCSSPATSATWRSRRSPQAYGERFINAGIAEQNMVSLAAGLAREGHLPWVYSIAPFVAFRPYEQIRNDVCLHKLPVKLVGNGGGYGYGIMGATHHALEDVGAMRVLPNMRLYVPLTAADVAAVVSMMAQDPLPNYLRLNTRRADSGRGPAFAPWRRLKTGGRCVVIGMGPVLGNLYELGDPALLDELEIWSVGTFPSRRFPPSSSPASTKSGGSSPSKSTTGPAAWPRR